MTKDVTDLPRTVCSDAPYPVVIKEARYGGSYAGGRWVLVAGLHEPAVQTGAWGSDTDCMSFWNERDEEGPALTQHVGNRKQVVYATAGDDPNELIHELHEYYSE